MKRIIVLALWLAALPAQAELYKWTDAQGRVHFTDRKPAEGGKVETLKTPQLTTPGGREAESASLPSAVGQKSLLDRQKRMADILAQEREQEEAAQARKKKEDAERLRKCHEARDYRRNAQGSRLYDIDHKGERVFMDDKAHDAHMRELDNAIKEFCK
ncbi:MAG: DUF4124 domain-containing protein [Gammaproteobacteria bacterium]